MHASLGCCCCLFDVLHNTSQHVMLLLLLLLLLLLFSLQAEALKKDYIGKEDYSRVQVRGLCNVSFVCFCVLAIAFGVTVDAQSDRCIML
jgi:succinate dehydrogenase hydrophobic anchor subunit